MNIDLIKKDRYIIIPFWILMFFIFWLQVDAANGVGTRIGAVCCTSDHYDMPCCQLPERTFAAASHETERSRAVCRAVCRVIAGCGTCLRELHRTVFRFGKGGSVSRVRLFHLSATQPYAFFVPVSAGVIINIAICGLRFFLDMSGRSSGLPNIGCARSGIK